MNCNCPLCESSKVFITNTFSIQVLQKEWLAAFNFDPFLDFPQLGQTLIQYRCGLCNLEFFSGKYYGDSSFYARLSTGRDWYYEESKWEFDEAIRRLNTNTRIKTLLEIGCGRGYFLEKVAACYVTCGIETNEAAVRVCETKNLNVTTDKLKTVNEKFDAIVAFELLEHIPYPREFLQQVSEILSPGGTLIFSVPNPEGYLREFDHELLNMPPHHATIWSQKTFEYVASQFGMKIVGITYEPLRYIHYQNYLRMLASRYHTFYGRSLRQKIQRKLNDLLTPILNHIVTPQGYQYHKRTLPGHTQLVEFKRELL